jgi:UPF0716 family protein affecting phage T7 exclusion
MLLELSVIPIYAAIVVALAFLIAGFISIYLAALMLLGMAKAAARTATTAATQNETAE